MIRQVHQKLRSQTGASITYALLLFLVCAVIGAVVLTAGTAAAGRVSQMAEMDQRYYSVSSAAELLAQELTGESKAVTVTRSQTIETTETVTVEVTVPEDGPATTVTSLPERSTDEPSYETQITAGSTPVATLTSSGASLPTNLSFLTGRALVLLFGSSAGETANANCNTAAAMAYTMTNGHGESGSFTMSVTGTNLDAEALAVNVDYSLKSDGSLVLTLSNTEGDPYTLRLTLKPVIRETESSTPASSTAVSPPSTTGNVTTYTKTTTDTTTLVKTSTIYWTVGSVEKIVSAPGGD